MNKRYLFCICLSVACLIVGCSKTNISDAKEYVETYLDATYKGEEESIKKYAKILEEDTEKYEDQIEEQYIDKISNALMEAYPDEEYGNISNLIYPIREAKKLAKYEVLKCEKLDDGYLVGIKVTPSNVFEKLKEVHSLEVSSETKNIAEIFEDYIKNAIQDHQYGTPKEIEVKVKVDGKKPYLETSEKEKIELALFPRRMGKKLLFTIFTGPNDIYFFKETGAIIGEGTEKVPNTDVIKLEEERVKQNWEKEFGNVFEPGALEKFLEQTSVLYYSQMECKGKAFGVKDIKLIDSSGLIDTYEVTVLCEDEEVKQKVEITYNSMDLVKRIVVE